MLVVLSTASVLGIIHLDMPLTAEILARTSPNILDLVIALAGGAAGAYATVSPHLGVGLVGVAISTALVPPLSVSAICMVRGETQLALGGALLFFANFMAIEAASSLVLWLQGYHRLGGSDLDPRRWIVRISVNSFFLAGLSVSLGLNFWQSLAKQKYETSVREHLKAELRSFPGVYLAGLRFESNRTKDTVTAVLRTPYAFEPNWVAALESKLPRTSRKQVELHIRSVITQETTRSGYLHTLPVVGSKPAALREWTSREARTSGETESSLR